MRKRSRADNSQRWTEKTKQELLICNIYRTAASHSSCPSPPPPSTSWSVGWSMCIKHQATRARWRGEWGAWYWCVWAAVLVEVNTIYSTKRKYVAWSMTAWLLLLLCVPCIIRDRRRRMALCLLAAVAAALDAGVCICAVLFIQYFQ